MSLAELITSPAHPRRAKIVTPLTQQIVDDLTTAEERLPAVYDSTIPGFHIRQQYRSNPMFFLAYQFGGRTQMLYIGSASKLTCDQARVKAEEAFAQVKAGSDPAGKRRAENTSRRTAQTVRNFKIFGR